MSVIRSGVSTIGRRSFLQLAGALTCVGYTSRSQSGLADEIADRSTAATQWLTERLNPSISSARETGLGLLKPSAIELERGLRLHAESIVFDSYGFSPRAAIDGAAVAREVEAGASDMEIKDLREEMSMTRCVTDAVQQQEYRDAWRASGVTCVFQNAGEECQDPLVLIKRLARFTFVTDMMRGFVTKASVPGDIEQAKANRQHCLYMTGNGVPLTQQWVSVADELRYVRIFYQLGIRMMHLTYQRRNMIGDGSGEPSDGGLSDFGREVIKEMNRVGVIPDCAHSGWKTSLESAKASSKPVVASHTTCAALNPNPHPRSKPDPVIRAICDSGGLVGICCIPQFLLGDGNLLMLLNHIDHVAKNFGVDHVAIGTDVAYSAQNSGEEQRKVPAMRKRRDDFRTLWPVDPFRSTAEMTSSLAWTNWPLFTVGLVQRGYNDDDIRKIIGGNVMRVASETMQG
ncbi:MAG TPA: dipeptidase [Planctomycetaceae bacterium]|nr:dipeptidase [Planctomycetaceae bacterium]